MAAAPELDPVGRKAHADHTHCPLYMASQGSFYNGHLRLDSALAQMSRNY